MSMASTIERKLRQAFRPSRLEVHDESARHAGHAGARPGGESHFHIVLVSEAFAGLSRLDRQRLVHEVLAAELAGQVHALRMMLRSPAEE